MNLPTVLVLVVIAVCVALALRSIFKQKKGGHCGGCSNEDCGAGVRSEACPSVQRALADVDAKLGAKDSSHVQEGGGVRHGE